MNFKKIDKACPSCGFNKNLPSATLCMCCGMKNPTSQSVVKDRKMNFKKEFSESPLIKLLVTVSVIGVLSVCLIVGYGILKAGPAEKRAVEASSLDLVEQIDKSPGSYTTTCIPRQGYPNWTCTVVHGEKNHTVYCSGGFVRGCQIANPVNISLQP